MRNIYEVNYMDDKNIDERIKNICLQAENNYILNYGKTNPQNDINNINNKNISSDKINGLNTFEDMSSDLDKTMTYSKEQNNYKNFSENKENNLFNKNDILNNNYNSYNNKYNSYNNNIGYNSLNSNHYNTNNNFISHNNNYNQNSNNRKPNNNSYNMRTNNETINKKSLHSRNANNTTFQIKKNSNISQEMINSFNNKVKYISNNMLSPNTFNPNLENKTEDDLVNYNSQVLLSRSEIKNHNHNHNNTNTFFSSSSSFCFECDLHKLINDKNIYNKDLNIKAQQNKEINKLILTAKSLLVKNKLNKVYDLLNPYIVNSNIKNPDLYYLYGETCRKLKYMEDSEKYLLDCMNFKNCSPYVYLSLAELYKEIGQIKYSKQFYKKCLLYFNKGNIYYNLAINYLKLNKPIKALNFITEAIDLGYNIPSYYKLRSDIYQNLGHKDLSEKDLYQYNILINKQN